MAIKCPKCHSDNPDDTRFCGNCAAPLYPSEEISAPTETLEAAQEELTTDSTFAGRYKVIEELGKGGMGRVYRALDKELNEEVALKLIRPEIAADNKTIARFKNELKLARQISHRYVGRMYELMEEEGKPFITMEYVKGEDLKSLVRKKEKIPEKESISIAKQIGEGLVEAHRLGVIHRDLKPQNIMIDREGNAKIMDFGIARSVEAPGVTQTGVMIGTPDYISPEQAEGEEAGQRSDIYSLGVILYEMVTGRLPFKGNTALSVALKHKAQLPQDPKKLNPELSEDLNRLILKCMEKAKERRYQNTEELLSDLRNLEKGIPLGLSRQKPFAFALKKKVLVPSLVIISLAIIGVIIWQLLPQKEAVSLPPDIPSIAVLPFKDMSPQKDQEYFCDGIAEELINTLTQIKDLRIVARTSAFSFKGEDIDIREIGKRLNVDKVLEGSVRKAGNRLRITAQLVNVADGYHLWSEKYDRDMEDIFAIQDEISLAIVDKLKPKLLGEEKARLMKRGTENLEAYNLYLQGLYFWNKRTEEGMKKGREFFQQAIENDPTYALAYAGLAGAFIGLGLYGFLHPKDALSKARTVAEKALEIDDALAEAYASLAWISMIYDWDWPTAEREFKRAIELNPGCIIAHFWYAFYLAAMERHDEALKEMRRAQELDPLSLPISTNVGWLFYQQRNYDRAIEQLQKTLEMNPNYEIALWNIGRAYTMKGKYEEAIAALQKAGIAGTLWAVGHLGYAYAVSGERDKAEKLIHELEELSKKRYVLPSSIGTIYLGLGEIDKAFEWWDKAFEEYDTSLWGIKLYPVLDSVRSDPRFKKLLKKMGLE